MKKILLIIVIFITASCSEKTDLTPDTFKDAEWYNSLAEKPIDEILRELDLNEFNPLPVLSGDSYPNSLDSLWGSNYSIHRIDYIEGYQVVESEFFTNIPILQSVLTHFGQDTTSFTYNFNDTLNTEDLNNYLGGWGSSHYIGLDTIYKDYWNSHGTICTSPSLDFIDANSTKWDEAVGVTSSAQPHKSFTLMVPISGGGNEIIYHFINNSNPASRR